MLLLSALISSVLAASWYDLAFYDVEHLSNRISNTDLPLFGQLNRGTNAAARRQLQLRQDRLIGRNAQKAFDFTIHLLREYGNQNTLSQIQYIVENKNFSHVQLNRIAVQCGLYRFDSCFQWLFDTGRIPTHVYEIAQGAKAQDDPEIASILFEWDGSQTEQPQELDQDREIARLSRLFEIELERLQMFLNESPEDLIPDSIIVPPDPTVFFMAGLLNRSRLIPALLGLGPTKESLDSLLVIASDIPTKKQIIRHYTQFYTSEHKKEAFHPLMIRAVERKDAATAKALLDMGADVNYENADHHSALYSALEFESILPILQADYDRIDLVELLLDRGARWDQCSDGLAPVHFVRTMESMRILVRVGARFDVNCGNGILPIHLITQKGSVGLLQLLLEQNVDVNVRLLVASTPAINCQKYGGFAPLHFAASSFAKTLTLLEAGTDVHALDAQGKTPLFYAQQPETIQVLLDHGANQFVMSDDGSSVLHEAARGCNDPKVIEALVDLGLDVNEARNDGKTPLHIAARYNGAAVVQRLIQLGAKVYAQDQDGNTPLQEALSKDARHSAHVTDVLVGAGAQ